MDDSKVYPSGTEFENADGEKYQFEDNEAGFKILVHARAMPVNVDSFAEKTLVATLGVTYEALTGVGVRRRLLSVDTLDLDLRAARNFDLRAFQPRSMPNALGGTATISMEMTLQGAISQKSVHSLVQTFEESVANALAMESSQYHLYDGQVAVEVVWSNDMKLWERPSAGVVHTRRLLQSSQRIKIDFTLARHGNSNAMPLPLMLEVFDRQIRSPFSPLMSQPLFNGAVMHAVYESELESTYKISGDDETEDVKSKLLGLLEADLEAESGTSM